MSWQDAGARYEFHPGDHDSGPKTIFGITRSWNGPDVIAEILLGLQARTPRPGSSPPRCGRSSPTPTRRPAWSTGAGRRVRRLAVDHRPGAARCSCAPEFWTTAVRDGLVRSPIEYVVAVLRATGPARRRPAPRVVAGGMGQEPFNPPNVSGWRPNGVLAVDVGAVGTGVVRPQRDVVGGRRPRLRPQWGGRAQQPVEHRPRPAGLRHLRRHRAVARHPFGARVVAEYPAHGVVRHRQPPRGPDGHPEFNLA